MLKYYELREYIRRHYPQAVFYTCFEDGRISIDVKACTHRRSLILVLDKIIPNDYYISDSNGNIETNLRESKNSPYLERVLG